MGSFQVPSRSFYECWCDYRPRKSVAGKGREKGRVVPNDAKLETMFLLKVLRVYSQEMQGYR